MFLLISIIAITAVTPSVNSIFLQNMIDTIENYSDKDLLSVDLFDVMFKWVIIYALWWESVNLIWRLYDYAYLKIMPIVKSRVIDELYNYIQYHNHEFFQNNMAGDIVNRITEASNSLEMVFTYSNEYILRKLVILLFALITFYTVSGKIALIFLIWMIFFIGISIYFSNIINNYSTIWGKNKAIVSGKIVDSLTNISVIRMFASHKHEHKYLRKNLDILQNSDQEMQWFMSKLRYVLGTSCTILICTIIYQLISLRSDSQITTGECVLIITLCLSLMEDCCELTEEFSELFERLGIFTQTLKLLENYTIVNSKKASKLIISSPKITFEDVSFHYKNNNNHFEKQSIIIEPYQKIGLAGFSGSGKTTFVSLILRLYEINSGKIYIDGQDIKTVTQESLRKSISVIPQEAILFHRSIKDNICYSNPSAPDEEVIEAAKKAHIHNYIISLPKGYNTICGERGNNLSGGQRQRIIIARAFLKQAPILILDEATSAIDNYTESLIQDSLEKLMQNKTVLIIAHRLSTLQQVDRVLIFNKGHIVEDGTHEWLQKNGEIYNLLWKRY